jgi:hypothetical protein
VPTARRDSGFGIARRGESVSHSRMILQPTIVAKPTARRGNLESRMVWSLQEPCERGSMGSVAGTLTVRLQNRRRETRSIDSVDLLRGTRAPG